MRSVYLQLGASLVAVQALCPNGGIEMKDYVAAKDYLEEFLYGLRSCRAANFIEDVCNERSDWIGGAVRLAFHDAGTWGGPQNSTLGGPDGCVDLTDPDNGGLQEVLADLASVRVDVEAAVPDVVSRFNSLTLADFSLRLPVFSYYIPVIASTCSQQSSMSQADWWVLVANACVEHAGGLNMGFQTGRVTRTDCAVNSATHGLLPDATKGYDHIEDVFVTRMGFTHREITALNGAHSLGRIRRWLSHTCGLVHRALRGTELRFLGGLGCEPWPA
jgi:hypothetical protein